MSTLLPIVKSDVVGLVPPTPVLSAQAWLDLLAFVNEFNLTRCDTDADRRIARIFLAAHIALCLQQGQAGIAGPLTSESAGGIRESYGMVQLAGMSALNTTRFGQLFSDMIGMTGAGLPTVV